jgi:hypothetical protein
VQVKVIPPDLGRVLTALGIAPDDVPDVAWVGAPFGLVVPDLEVLAPWLGERNASAPAVALALRPAHDPLVERIRVETLHALAMSDLEAASRHARAVPEAGPLEGELGLGALATMSARAAARDPEAASAVRAITPLLGRARPVARLAVARLGEVGLGEGPIARRARAVLEDGLTHAIEQANALGARGALANLFDPQLATLVDPGMLERAGAAAGRILDLVTVLGALAAHREGLTVRLSALAPRVPSFAGPLYVVAYLAALGVAHPGPYLHEVHARLARAVAEDEPQIQALALEALAAQAGTNPSLVPALEQVIVDALTDSDPEVRVAAALACSELPALPAAAVGELENMLRYEEAEEVLAAVRALARSGRTIPEDALAELDDPVVAASARVLAAPADAVEEVLATLIARTAERDLAELVELSERASPVTIAAEALHRLSPARAAIWIERLATATAELGVLGAVVEAALDACEVIPDELAASADALVDVLATGAEDHATSIAPIVGQLRPFDDRLERLILARTAPPVSLRSLAALDRLGEDTAERLLAIIDDPLDEYAPLAVAALGRCALGAAQVPDAVAALCSHLRDDDALASVAHAALVELAARGVIS